MAEYDDFAGRAERFLCPPHMIERLSKTEIDALTAYQREFVVSLRRLYLTMKPQEADAFLLPLYLGFGD